MKSRLPAAPAEPSARPRSRSRSTASRRPASLDWLQAVSGLVPAPFMRGHVFLVSSILLVKDAMWTVPASLPRCRDECPKLLPLPARTAFLRRKMVFDGLEMTFQRRLQ